MNAAIWCLLVGFCVCPEHWQVLAERPMNAATSPTGTGAGSQHEEQEEQMAVGPMNAAPSPSWFTGPNPLPLKKFDISTAFDDIGIPEADASKNAIDTISKFYEPETGPMAKVLNGIEAAHNASHEKADLWYRNAAAMNSAYRGIKKATYGAQTVMMHDSMAVNDGIRNQVLHRTLLLEPIKIDPAVRQEIRAAHGDPRKLHFASKDPKKNMDLKGSHVIISGRYKGEREHLLRGHIGVLEEYDEKKDKWKVKLTDERLDLADFHPEVKISEVEMLPEGAKGLQDI